MRSPTTISVADLKKIVGVEQANDILGVLAQSTKPQVTKEQVGAFLDMLDGKIGRGTFASLPVVRRFTVDNPKSRALMARYGQDLLRALQQEGLTAKPEVA